MRSIRASWQANKASISSTEADRQPGQKRPQTAGRWVWLTGCVLALSLVLGGSIGPHVFAQEATPQTQQPVMIGDAQLTWTGDWTYTVGSSSTISDQVTFSQTDLETQVLKVLSYGLVPVDAGADATAAIATFAESYLTDGGATDLSEVRTGQLDTGTVWAVYTSNASESAGTNTFGETSLASLITAGPAAAAGYVVTSLTTNTPLLREAVMQVQTEFVLDGTSPLLAGIDAADVTADLPTENVLVTGAEPGSTPEATPLASPEITVATSAAATPPGSPEAVQVNCSDATPALTTEEATLAAVQGDTETPLAIEASTPEATPVC